MTKKKLRSMLPYKIKYDDLWAISHSINRLADYRDDQLDPKQKIRTRLFYRNDDLPKDLWALPIPADLDVYFKWNKHLITMVHNHRVGIFDARFLEDHDENHLDDDCYACLFEDYNDLLLFKLSV